MSPLRWRSEGPNDRLKFSVKRMEERMFRFVTRPHMYDIPKCWMRKHAYCICTALRCSLNIHEIYPQATSYTPKQYNAIAVEGWYHKLVLCVAEQKR